MSSGVDCRGVAPAHGRAGVWYSMPMRPRRVLNSFSTVSASSVLHLLGRHARRGRRPGSARGCAPGRCAPARRPTALLRNASAKVASMKYDMSFCMRSISGLLLGMLLDQRADAVLAEADVAALVGDRARERVRELRVHLLVHRVHHLEDAEGHALEDDVLADDAGDEVLLVDLLEQDLGELHQVRVGVAAGSRPRARPCVTPRS